MKNSVFVLVFIFSILIVIPFLIAESPQSDIEFEKNSRVYINIDLNKFNIPEGDWELSVALIKNNESFKNFIVLKNDYLTNKEKYTSFREFAMNSYWDIILSRISNINQFQLDINKRYNYLKENFIYVFENKKTKEIYFLEI
jgi:hypothetical protein